MNSLLTADSGARLDRLPISSFHRRIMLLIGTGMFFDGFDIYVAATVLGATLKSGFSTMGQNAQFMSVTFVGMMLGSFMTGFLGDRYGRRFTYQANLAIFGLAAIASAFAPSMTVLTLLRFIMGVGLGAENVVGYSTMTEFVPPGARGNWLGGMNVIVVSGLPVAALLGTLIIPLFGWRAMFALGGLGALVVWYLRKALPESPRWLESVGRTAEAEALLQSIESEVSQQHGSLVPPVPRSSAPPSASLGSLVQSGTVASHDRRSHDSDRDEHFNLRVRDLAALLLRTGGAKHRHLLPLLVHYVARRATRVGHRSLRCRLLGAQAHDRRGVPAHHCARRHLSVHPSAGGFDHDRLLADHSHLYPGRHALCDLHS